MKIKRKYSTPDIEQHFLDASVSLDPWSGITPPGGMSAPESHAPPAAPEFENPSAADYPFGGEGPDYTNM